MILEDFFEIVPETVTIYVVDTDTGDTLDLYDGKNSIDKKYNKCKIDHIFPLDKGVLEVRIINE